MIKEIYNSLKSLFITRPTEPVQSITDSLAGENVYCICCNKSFITFLPYGVKPRANALCPNCNSLERHRLHYHYMVNKTNLVSRGNIKFLHVAPEIVLYKKFMGNALIEYVPAAKFGEGFSDRYEYPPGTIDVDITDICFDDSVFDAIYCSHVLEHIPADSKAMKEMYRVLKPGGWAILQVPLDKERQTTYEDFSITDQVEREKAFGQWDHVRVYGNDYAARLQAAGFIVNIDAYTENFSLNELFKNGFMKGEDIYYCTKKNV